MANRPRQQQPSKHRVGAGRRVIRAPGPCWARLSVAYRTRTSRLPVQQHPGPCQVLRGGPSPRHSPRSPESGLPSLAGRGRRDLGAALPRVALVPRWPWATIRSSLTGFQTGSGPNPSFRSLPSDYRSGFWRDEIRLRGTSEALNGVAVGPSVGSHDSPERAAWWGMPSAVPARFRLNRVYGSRTT